ncbi:reducing type I polyketide synthase [Myriangium duriaei CBS 260.36]|uniref:Reducing type I polyketide synthase n=1 Tax=Myriangium duriaei CBS 260.36 TaxID=1168546 RepID=A0A9P4MJU9_9PEZI|nr:reducing type I polyketide synthase [Myriangium duriaei CBS 260.36]
MQTPQSHARTGTESSSSYDPIAIVGFAMKFPGDANSIEGFWDMLIQGRCASTNFPQDRLNVSGLYHPDAARHDTLNLKGGHFLQEDVAAFDAPFFSISSAEATSMDPQQRLLLETTYRALENAGMPIKKVTNSRTCVFAGSFMDDYKTLYTKDVDHAASYAAAGIPNSCNSNRISWFFNLRGNSATIDTACSSSLVALDLACKSIQSGESSMGIVTGVNLMLAADFFLILSDMGMLSPDSRCWSFSECGNGYGRGEGAGALIIKRVSDAIKDGDTIRAVIRSTSSNSDGYTPGITQPSQISQAELIRDCYRNAGLDLNRTGYAEAHGTGTPVGDPIEANALGNAFRENRDAAEPLYIGAVKSNIGHLEGSSGVAGIIKTILVLERGVIPQIASLQNLNPRIDEEFLKLKFPKKTMAWPLHGLRRASVNSFGYGGTNSHAVLDDALHFLKEHGLEGNHCTVSSPPKEGRSLSAIAVIHKTPNDAAYLWNNSSKKTLLFSAADRKAVARMAQAYHGHLTKVSSKLSGSDLRRYLESVAYTLALRRSDLPWKAFAVVDVDEFDSPNFEKAITQPIRATTRPKIALIFTGQGAQWATMGQELAIYDVFASSLQQEIKRPRHTSQMNDAGLSQPICTALQIALVDLLRTCGVSPEAVIGHSSGEIAAAYCIGAFTMEAALKIAFMRGLSTSTLRQKSSVKGAMLSVGLSAESLQPYLKDVPSLVIACYNSPRSVTVSGDEVSVDRLKYALEEDEVFTRKLVIDLAYHSPHMQMIAQNYADSLAHIDFGFVDTTGCAMFSSVTGRKAVIDELRDPSYWVKNLISPVQFTAAFEHIDNETITKKLDKSHLNFFKVDVCVEVGPHAALRGPIRDILNRRERDQSAAYTSLLERGQNALVTFLQSLSLLHCCGYPVDWLQANHQGAPKNSLISLCDLPEYPFDHSIRYWHESRIARASRLRTEPRLDLLGKQINGVTLFPAAGMMCMAIEGLNQLVVNDESIKGFELRDIAFHTALIVPMDGVQVELHVSKDNNPSRRDMNWRLFALSKDEWIECCCGTARYDYSEQVSEINDGTEDEKFWSRRKLEFDRTRQACASEVDVSLLYRQMEMCGFGFGSAFQSIRDGRFTEKTVTADITCYRWSDSSSTNPRQDHIIHPCTLDGLLQPAIVAFTKGGTKTATSLVPTSVRRLWIPKVGLAWPRCDSLEVLAQITQISNRGFEMQCSATTKDDDLVGAVLEGVRFTHVSKAPETKDDCTLWALDWKPDVDLMTVAALEGNRMSGQAQDSEPVVYFKKLSFLLYTFLNTTIRQMPMMNSSKLPPHFVRYLNWANMQCQRLSSAIAPDTSSTYECMALDQTYVDRIQDEFEGAAAKFKVFSLVGQNLLEILCGRVDVLELLYHSSLIHDHYEEVTIANRAFKMLDQYLGAYSHKYPEAQYLEVGAGTGGSTYAILESLLHYQEPRYGPHLYQNYTFTDISESFFEKAKERFSNFPNIDYKLFDIEKSPAEQGFEDKSFDCIIAANVVHATRSLANTLSNLHRLLRPGGRLILFELTNPTNIRSGFWTGLLPGWWLSCERYRSDDNGPCISSQEWHRVLIESGFSGVDVLLRDHQEEAYHLMSIMVSSVPMFPSPVPMVSSSNKNLEITLLHATVTDDNSDLKHLEGAFQRKNMVPSKILSCMALSNLATGDICVVIELPGQPLLRSWCNEDLEGLRQLLLSYNTIVWVTQKMGDLSHPDYGMIDGLARVIRNEYTDLKFVTIALAGLVNSERSDKIAAIATRSLNSAVDSCETAFQEKDGYFQIWRFMSSRHTSQAISELKAEELQRDIAWNDGSAVKMTTKTPGMLDSLQFVEDDDFSTPLRAEDVEIQVHAIGVNFKDCLVALNQVDGDGLGIECSGIITRVGSDCPLLVGERVCMATTEAFKTYARGHYQCTARLPEHMSFIEGAAFPVQFFTAWACLVDLARLERNGSVLIHAGAGGTGQAAVQIAQHIGAEVFVTVSSEAKKNQLIEHYGLEADHILYSRDTSFAKAIHRLTDGRGVDVILNSLAGISLLRSWDCLAPYGRFVEIGKKDILENWSLPMIHFNRCRSFMAFDGIAWIKERPADVGRLLSTIVNMFSEGHLRTAQPLHVNNITEVASVFRRLADGKSGGKTVIQIMPETVIPAILKRRTIYTLESDKTYVIAGGLGGVGRRIARWMVNHGARYLLLLSRSGVKDAAAAKFITELEAAGARITTPQCDISDETALADALEECTSTMPQIRGCVQASMVLNDGLITHMNIEQWEAATKPKVQGSWNLHKLLPKKMDFFICLSSMSGIHGLQGQANYAAGNTYLDAFARHRVSRGEKAISIDLGAIASEGYVAENKIVMERLANSGTMRVVPSRDFDALMEYYCNPHLPVLSPADAQIIIGINTPQLARAQGRDPPEWMRQPIYRIMHRMPGIEWEGHNGSRGPEVDFRTEFVQSETVVNAANVATRALAAKLARTLISLAEEDVDIHKAIHSFGVDSLLAVELRSWLSREFDAEVAVFEIIGGSSCATVGLLVANKSLLRRTEGSSM